MTTLEMHPDAGRRPAHLWPVCANCAFFVTQAAQLEARLPGLNSLASGFASVRGDDGFCDRHERLLGAASACRDFLASSSARLT
jgi:hypothetical protein